MRILFRSLNDHRGLWRVWALLLLLSAILPVLAAAMPLVQRQFVDGVVLARRPDRIWETAAAYGALWLLSTLVQIGGAGLRAYLTEQLTLRLRWQLFRHCQALSVAFSQREHSGRTAALFANEVPSRAGLLTTTALGLAGSIVAIVVGCVTMFSMSWQLALVAAAVPPIVGGAAAIVTRPLRPAARRAQEKAAELSERLHESLAGMRELIAFGRERSQGRRFALTLGELVRLRMRVVLMETGLGTGQSVLSLVVALVIMGYGGYLAIQGQTTLGTLVAMQSLFGLVFQPASQLAGLMSGAQKALAAADRVYAFLDEPPQVRERPTARQLGAVHGTVQFDDVQFSYLPGRGVLHGVAFHAQPGQPVALVGPSGAGKSTLASLIARFYDPTGGRVLLDGEDLRGLTLTSVRQQIGFVFQDTFLFAASIGENVAFGREGASEAGLIAAARAANAWEFIERLPAGLDTHVGERGVQLSEGQKQRLAIARAILRDPRILILDEPTSALDARSEYLLQTALDNATRGRTTFVIAHRLSTVERADLILVLDGGRVVQRGSHGELLAQPGLYRELFELQHQGAVHVDLHSAEIPLAAAAVA